jgi:hypothetical protein
MIELGADGGRGGVVTDAGFFALWDPAKFHEIDDFDSWESEVFDELEDHEDAGAIVSFHDADGVYQLVVRIGSATAPARLDDREARYRGTVTGPHLFVSAGAAMISGIEYVGDSQDVGLRVDLPAGRWSVVVTRIDWESEPDSRDGDGKPSPNALPDFVVVINPEDAVGADTGSR